VSTPALSLRRYGHSKGSHAHAHVQVLWGWQGALDLEVGGRGLRVRRGDAVVIAPGERHDFWSAAGSACLVLDCAADQHPALAALAGRALALDAPAQHLLHFLAAQPALPEAWQAPAAAMLLAALPAAPQALPRTTARRIDWEAIDAWIDAHLGAPIAVAQLAALACLSPSQFAARCVEAHGLAPIAYVRRRRLALARRLRAAGWPVQRIAERCGYRSPSALTAALRRAG
jgi:AraC-type DNA-binding domain-containing proteins